MDELTEQPDLLLHVLQLPAACQLGRADLLDHIRLPGVLVHGDEHTPKGPLTDLTPDLVAIRDYFFNLKVTSVIRRS